MKRVFAILAAVLLIASLFAQSPQKMSYQAVIRNSSNQLVTNHAVGIQISILQGSATGTPVYVETQTPTTNVNGLVTLEIGSGTPVTGTFAGIDWSTGTYFIKTETDPAGGTSYTITGTSQLLSVPYALHAKTVASYSENDPVFTAHAASGVTPALIGNWNTAYGWGNHVSAGYLTSFTEVDPVFLAHPANGITGINITNWNTAYGWGNHASAGYAPGTRTLTINGTTLDLTANRIWNVGTVTSVGLSLPDIFSLSGSPVTTTGTLTATLASQTANQVFASPNASSGTPSFRVLVNADIPNLDWSKITSGKPTTLAGYGITDAVNTTGNQTIAGNKTFTGTATVPTPVNASDAATKAYVDALMNQLYESGALRVRDIDNNYYNTIKIGDQVWMAENLKTTKYSNGDLVGTTSPYNKDISGEIDPKYQWAYDGNESNVVTYGRIYTWYAVTDSRNVCPAGWHVPADAEWTTLENYLIAHGYNYDGTTTGNKIAKALTSTSLWPSSTVTGAVGNTDYPAKRNATGFTALPGGYRYSSGAFDDVESFGFWWSATEGGASDAWARFLYYDYSNVWRLYYNKKYGFSVRCLRD